MDADKGFDFLGNAGRATLGLTLDFQLRKEAQSVPGRVPTGIPGMDELIEGGFEQGSTVLLTGGAGTGKTTLALQFLYNGAMEANEPGLFITFEEDKESLYRHTARFGWDFKALEEALLSFSTTSVGVAAGTTSAYHPYTSYPDTPLCEIVGTFSMPRSGCREVTPSATIRPPST